MTQTNDVLPAVLRIHSARTMLIGLGALTASLLVLAYFTLVRPDASTVTIWLNDVMGLTDAAYRTYMGQVPSIDFRSLYGAAVYYPAALGFHLGFDVGGVLAFGNFVVAVPLLIMAVLAGYRRFPILHSALLVLFLFFLIVVPMRLGGEFLELTYGIYYTRHGWAALTIVFLFYLEPHTTRRGDLVLDAVVLSILLVYLFYLKITFGAVALAFVLVNSITSRYKLWLSVIALSIFLSFVAATWIFTEYNSAYFRDILSVVSRNPAVQRGARGILAVNVEHLGLFLLCFAALAAVYRTGHRTLFDLAFVTGAIISSQFLLDKSGGTLRGLPALITVFLICGELARRAECRIEAATSSPWPRNVASMCLLGMLLAFVAKPTAERALALRAHFNMTTSAQSESQPSLSGIYARTPYRRTDLHEMLGHDDTAHALFAKLRDSKALYSFQYLPLLIEGAELIGTVAHADQSILTFAQSNPFSAVLGLRPTKPGYPFFWAQNARVTSLPSPERYLADADLVMVPIVPHNPRQLKVLMAAYGAFLEDNFQEIRRSTHWRLFERL